MVTLSEVTFKAVHWVFVRIQCPPELLAPFSKIEQNDIRKKFFIVYPHDLSFKIFTKIEPLIEVI